ncbi:Oidioi.mRNA.OKI2018_I69.XSR.g16154.t1.cds [Oikopleura dioica]|uniref:Oidioi.mRNA.OKI2018_I69.XSR.g16154.t1.cds n=1 Tax=Oikopleura dioica TaxID=34765 RepID=A0ABN7SJ78_OIKDI|nr:Oidioi.mRNA.OKI2018_I69.XSR.g16154.t1.cds [Oikopleura dioica]
MDSSYERRLRIAEAKRVRLGLTKIVQNATRESQQLDAMRQAWTAGLQVQALERHWQEFENTECGAELELSAMRVPFVMHEKKKKTYRKAIYAVARLGHQVKESELYIFTKETTEVVITNMLSFSNVSPDFELVVDLYGMELPEKEKKGLSPETKFIHWARCKLSGRDATNRTSWATLTVLPNAPKYPSFTGKITLRLASAVPTLCQVFKEGYLHLWNEGVDNSWKFIFVRLKNGKLRAFDPTKGEKKCNDLVQIDVTSQLKISESSRKRQFSFQLRDFDGRTVFAATSKDEMLAWMEAIRVHRRHLKLWGKIEEAGVDEGMNEPDSVTDTNSPWSAFFSGQTKVTVIKTGKRVGSGQAALSPAVGVTKGSRRRSKSVDLGHTPVKRVSRSPERRFRRNSGSREDDPRLVASPPRDWMNSANRLLPNVQMMPRYDPPTILLGPSEEDENHEETINDTRHPAHDYRYKAKTCCIGRKSKKNRADVRREPLRTSTQINGTRPEISEKYTPIGSPARTKYGYAGEMRAKIVVPTKDKVKFGGCPKVGRIQRNNLEFHDSIHPEDQKLTVRRALDGNEAIFTNPHAEHLPAPCLPRFPHLEEI